MKSYTNVPLRESHRKELDDLTAAIDIKLEQIAGKRMCFVAMIVPAGGDGTQLQAADVISNIASGDQVKRLIKDASRLGIDG